MGKIPKKFKEKIACDEFYEKCAIRQFGGCQGRITIDHSLIFGGRQIEAMWNYVPLCAKHHGVDQFSGGKVEKEKSHWIALNRATDEELKAKSKAVNYIHERNRLNKIYGTPNF